MYLSKTLYTVIGAGTRHVKDRHKKLLINKVNGVACSLILLSLIFGILFYALSGYLIVLLSTIVESLLLSSIIILNHYGRHKLAAFSLQMVLNGAILYFGLLLGNAIDGLWLALFLIVTSFLFLKTRTAQVISLTGGSISLVLIETNKYLQFVPPFPFTPMVQLVVHYSAIGVILFLTVLTLMHYIQHNKLLVAEVQEHTGELEKANRSLRVFMRELTHEIRTPLNAIYSISQLKLMEARPGNESITNEHLHFACHNVLSIINNVQDRSKMEAGKPDELKREAFNLRSWMHEVCNIYRYFANTKGVTIQVSIDERLPAVIFEDKTSLTKIANNIIGNAIKFTRKHTVVTVSIFRQEASWMIAVKDQGKGIPPEKITTLFDEFTRERINFAEGTGLGLNIAKKLANHLQGDIRVNSEQGTGTTFIISLPLREYQSRLAENASTGKELSGFQGKKVLLVEDDLMSQQYLSRFLSAKGFQVAVAEDGLEGLYTASGDQFDVIISDMGLPRMGGRELLAHLKDNTYLQHIPVIITSADTAIKDDILKAGASSCLIKPVDFKVLHRVLQDLIHSRTLIPENRA
ncbi:response regulator [Chitinophaga agrisoli]|uniref:histidine kinase n=1 Tax=Chitinophaga agrisoli TaxID=2607653 RepID=A0A5B2VK72_9BACT|nr:ATP-binding protein [Chitinophaga agrisoli]KAA2238692.1 response regulator [Chitinophaga agrisoli]